MKLNQLVNPASMKHDIDNGLIKVTKHPSLPLDIYNYTERAQFSKKWNIATTVSRGLIVNRETNEIIARPFPKFFNYEERPNLIGLDDPVRVVDKMDGSLGILYPIEDPYGGTEFAVATRGSFQSDQAKHATQVWRERYSYRFQPPYGWTMLFEIIYPDNRIVVDYGDTDDLFFLGAVDIWFGTVTGPESVPEWPGPRASGIVARTLREALSLPPRANREGVVVRSLKDYSMVKIKQEDYVQLHRIVTGLNRRAVWEMLRQGLNPYEGVPDELHDWVSDTASVLQASFDSAKIRTFQYFNNTILKLNQEYSGPENWTRKDFAVKVQKQDWMPWVKKCMFLLLDNQSLDEYLWKLLKPTGEENTSVF